MQILLITNFFTHLLEMEALISNQEVAPKTQVYKTMI